MSPLHLLCRLSRRLTFITVKEEQKDRFCLPPEDYLHGIISMVNELVRAIAFVWAQLYADLRIVTISGEFRDLGQLRRAHSDICVRQGPFCRIFDGKSKSFMQISKQDADLATPAAEPQERYASTTIRQLEI